MKSFILSSLMLGVTAMFTGCGDETKKETTSKTVTPGGSTTVTDTVKKVDKGDMKESGSGTGTTSGTTAKP